MKLLGYEMKKLMNWKIIGLVVIISAVFYQLFMAFDFEYFPNGKNKLHTFMISREMITEYGQEMNEQEFSDFQQTYRGEVEKANQYLQSNEEFAEAGISTYEQFTKSSNELRDKVMFDRDVDVFWELQAREGIMNQYELRTKMPHIPEGNEKERKRIQEVKNSGGMKTILPNEVVSNYNSLISSLAVLIVLSVMIVVSRVHITEEKSHMRMLQYTTHKGRYLFKTKIAASCLSAFFITAVHLAVFFMLYRTNHTGIFLDSRLHSFLHFKFYWIEFSFLGYILTTVGAVFILSFITAAVALFISRMVSRYITLVGGHIPMAVILIFLISQYLVYYLLTTDYPMYLTITTYAGLIAVSTFLLVYRWTKEKRMDIV
ncbi:hypothetical protein [Salibacterium halotolerans]|uniref:ABC-2 family transporter protein n=1 Tax=Salibacterium halotolerans TaxID=1884432 RepID=A0A1I5Y8B0_9BACI|nr:hypothetical protein [Salibacterium halotolerans]SFQ40147.1 hypothetical protein SAMN05518683_13712 [Salibacterium halotolerans]